MTIESDLNTGSEMISSEMTSETKSEMNVVDGGKFGCQNFGQLFGRSCDVAISISIMMMMSQR